MSSVSTAAEKKRRVARRGPAPTSGTPVARRRAAAILEVLAGVRRPSEAAVSLGTSLPRYYQLEQRALVGLLRACEPALRGPRVDPARQLATLERENRRLKRDCDRQQALVRMAERSLGLTPPSPVKSTAKDAKPSSRKRRQRRPSVRALQVVRGLRSDGEAEDARNGDEVTPVSSG